MEGELSEIINIRLLKAIYTQCKDLHRSNRKKIPILEKEIDIIMNEAIKKDKKNIPKKVGHNKNKEICNYCDRIIRIDNDYKYNYNYTFHKSGSCRNFKYVDKAKKRVEEIQGDISKIVKFINEIEKRIKEINYWIKEYVHRCMNCKKLTRELLNISCSYSHVVCGDCIEKVDDKCIICKQVVEMESCPICMVPGKKLVETGCGNGHHTCITCLKRICDTTFRKCPYCRGDI